MFLTFEGVDGCGKTTQVELLQAYLEAQGRRVVATREPGGTPLGELLRDLVLRGGKASPWAEAALFAAARAELVADVIEPALASGAIVICDRYIDSSLAYQGVARGLGIEKVMQLNLHAIGGLMPDLTFLLLVDSDLSERRIGEDRDRIESENVEFRHRVDAGFRQLAEMYPRRIVAIDGTQSPEAVARLIRGALEDAGEL